MESFFTVLGGMGTLATESFLRILNKASHATSDQTYLDYVVLNHASVPDRTAYLLGKSSENPLPYLEKDIRQMDSIGTDFFVLTCNTAHAFFDELQAKTEIEILHMPREAVRSIVKKVNPLETPKVAVLATEGTMAVGIYQSELESVGFGLVKISDAIQQQVNQLIYTEVKEKANLNTVLLDSIISQIDTADFIILGCTELSAVYELMPKNHKIIDAQQVLCDRVIEKTKRED